MVNAPERSLGGRRLAGNRTSRSVWSARVFHRSFPRARLWGVEGPSRSSYDSHRATTISLLLESREAFGVRVYPTALPPERGCGGGGGASRSTGKRATPPEIFKLFLCAQAAPPRHRCAFRRTCDKVRLRVTDD